MASANRYLKDIFIPQFWQQKVAVIAKNQDSEFTVVPEHTNLDDVCVQKESRKIRNDHKLSYWNKFYLIESPLKHSIAKQKIEIRKTSNRDFIDYFAGRHLAVSEVIEHSKLS